MYAVAMIDTTQRRMQYRILTLGLVDISLLDFKCPGRVLVLLPKDILIRDASGVGVDVYVAVRLVNGSQQPHNGILVLYVERMIPHKRKIVDDVDEGFIQLGKFLHERVACQHSNEMR